MVAFTRRDSLGSLSRIQMSTCVSSRIGRSQLRLKLRKDGVEIFGHVNLAFEGAQQGRPATARQAREHRYGFTVAGDEDVLAGRGLLNQDGETALRVVHVYQLGHDNSILAHSSGLSKVGGEAGDPLLQLT